VARRTDLRETAIFGGRRGGARPSTFPDRTRPDAHAGGLTARELRPMDPRYRPTLSLDSQRSAVRHPSRQERIPVNHSFTSLNHLVADLRTADLLAEAARYRVARDGRVTRQASILSVFATLRRVVGATLVRSGERVHGAGRQTAPAAGASDLDRLAGHLRLVR
jgi:hypothetical protein